MEETIIKNLEIYNIRMDKSIEDKLWFKDKVDADVYVDFGCANGNLLKHMYRENKNKVYIGYDNNQEMLSIAEENCKETIIKFTPCFKNIRRYLNIIHPGKKVCLILSSVLHEVYSYSKNSKELDQFWNSIQHDLQPDYIVIRDMTYGCDWRNIDSKDLESFLKETIDKIKKKANKDQLQSFERFYGKIEEEGLINVTHFLLKYKYVENWDREVQENYIPLIFPYIGSLLNLYKTSYKKEYCLPYLREQFKKDFDIDFIGYTHYNLLLEKA